jgi:hypothetical protein
VILMASPVQVRSTGQLGSVPFSNEAYSSAVSWGAVIGGAFVAAALSLLLLALGTGIGLSESSPWSYRGASQVSAGAIIWLILAQILASAMGGYLAGRLRTKWVNVHSHEVYFRDTAHGFLVWCVGLVITAGFLASAAAAVVGGTRAGGPALDPNAYFVDSLFRSDNTSAAPLDPAVRTESGLILAKAVQGGNLSGPDQTYVAQLVSARTGLNQAEAQRRVSVVFEQARQEADNARRMAAHSLYWTFLALLIGAFFASYAATIGGRQRDHLAVATI